MKLGRTLAGLDQLQRGSLVQFLLSGPVGSDREHIEITQLTGFLCPERLQHIRRVRPPLREKIAQPQQVVGLERIGLITHHGFKRRNSFEKLILLEVDKADVAADSSLVRYQTVRFMERLQSLRTLLAA